MLLLLPSSVASTWSAVRAAPRCARRRSPAGPASMEQRHGQGQARAGGRGGCCRGGRGCCGWGLSSQGCHGRAGRGERARAAATQPDHPPSRRGCRPWAMVVVLHRPVIGELGLARPEAAAALAAATLAGRRASSRPWLDYCTTLRTRPPAPPPPRPAGQPPLPALDLPSAHPSLPTHCAPAASQPATPRSPPRHPAPPSPARLPSPALPVT